MKKILSLGIFTGLFIVLTAFTPGTDCAIMHGGTFTYTSNGQEVVIVIKGNKHTESHSNGKFVIESTLEWLSECEYRATLVNCNDPDLPFPKGTKLRTHIDKVDGKTIYYSSYIEALGPDTKTEGKLKKVKD